MSRRNSMRDYTTADILNTPIARGGILPFTEYADRSEFDPANSGLTGAIWQPFNAPARAYRGELSDDQMIREAFNFAGSMTLGNLMTGAAAPIKNNAMAAYKALGPQDASADTLRTARIAGADRFVVDDAATAFANKRPSTLTGDELIDMLRASGMGPANSNSATAELFANAKTGAAVPLATRALEGQQSKGITAYHGSPHDFDRFSMEHIGTGEGAQAYGHGLYFAENEGVAKAYRDELSLFNASMETGGAFEKAHANSIADNLYNEYVGGKLPRSEIEKNGGVFQIVNKNEFVRFPDGSAGQLASDGELLRAVSWPAGHMYEVRINADPEDFLDWDKPLSQQSEKVRSLFADANPDTKGLDLYRMAQGLQERTAPTKSGDPMRDAIASQWHDLGAMDYTKTGASEQALREAGIPGIRYLDQMSRGAGEGSSNYVLFDDALIEILRKYGWLGPVGAGTMANAMSREREVY